MDKATRRLLKQYPELEYMKDKGIVKCKLGGHEMQCKVEAIESYVSGKKFKKLRDKHQDKLPEHLLRSKIHQGKLFCSLTNCYINCSSNNIDRHTTGRKYQRALQQFQQGSLELYKELLDSSADPIASDSDVDQDQGDDIIDDQDNVVDHEDDDGQDDDHNDDDQDSVDHKVDEDKDDSDEGQDKVKVVRSKAKQNRKRKAFRKFTSKHKSKKIRIQ